MFEPILTEKEVKMPISWRSGFRSRSDQKRRCNGNYGQSAPAGYKGIHDNAAVRLTGQACAGSYGSRGSRREREQIHRAGKEGKELLQTGVCADRRWRDDPVGTT